MNGISIWLCFARSWRESPPEAVLWATVKSSGVAPWDTTGGIGSGFGIDTVAHTLDLWNEGQVKVDNVELAQDTARRGGRERVHWVHGFNGSQDPMDGTGTVYAGEAL